VQYTTGWLLEVLCLMWERNFGLHYASNDHLPVPMQQVLSPIGLQRCNATYEIHLTAHDVVAVILMYKATATTSLQDKSDSMKEKV
jgi:hypothetical protein